VGPACAGAREAAVQPSDNAVQVAVRAAVVGLDVGRFQVDVRFA